MMQSKGPKQTAQTRGAEMLALRRARMAASPPILRGGYRPFFLGAAIWAAVALAGWMAIWFWGLTLPSHFDPLSWHRHEMLFGFVGAAIAGYMLTAIPNWSGWLPVTGASLAGLFALWLAGRVAVFCSAYVGAVPAMLLDAGFFFVLAGFLLREILGMRGRNMPMLVMLVIFGCANILDHADSIGWLVGLGLPYGIGARAGVALVVVLMSVVGGRLVPSFTRNLIIKRQLGGRRFGQPDRIDRMIIGATAVALVPWTFFAQLAWTGWLLAGAAVLQLWRLLRWRGWKVVDDPIVIILHVGYVWIPIGLGILALDGVLDGYPVSAALHALTAGAMATMILAVMTRTILGQTGRPPRASRATSVSYLLVVSGAVVRVFGPLLPFAHDQLLLLAALLWGGGFLLFALVYGRLLLLPRVDNPYG